MSTNVEKTALMSTLPGDDVRQIMWRFSDRYDLQMVIQSARSVARGLGSRPLLWSPNREGTFPGQRTLCLR